MHKDNIAILNFYSFVHINEPEFLIPKILLVAMKKRLKGTILIAQEGFNGGVSGRYEDAKFLLEKIIEYTDAQNVISKVNYSTDHVFGKLRVKLKEEIISMGIEKLDVNTLKGNYIEPKEWDDFVTQDDVILVDTRNDYEVEIGTFENSINPNTYSFKQFPKWVENNHELLKNKKIAMCCTGGVRCEKSTAYLKQLGYQEVYHLKGGILQYLEETKNQNNLWKGECFVFDDRESVDNVLKPINTIL
jgi:UPF0176 protein